MDVLGISKLMNPLNIDQGKDGDEVEKHLTGRSAGPPVVQTATGASVTAEMESELRDLMADYGLTDSEDEDDEPPRPAASASHFAGKENAAPSWSQDTADFVPKSSAAAPSGRKRERVAKAPDWDASAAPDFVPKSPAPPGRSLGFAVGGVDLGSGSDSSDDSSDDSDDSDGSSDGSDGSDGSERETRGRDDVGAHGREARPRGFVPKSGTGRGAGDFGTKSGGAASSILRDLEKEWDFDLSESSFEQGRSVTLPPPSDGPSFEDHRAARRSQTEEEAERRHIEEVMGNLRDETRTSFGAQNERAQDIKANKLEQIAQLRDTLKDDGIKTDMVGNPSMSSPMEEIDMVLRTLRMKNDRNRCASLAEEVILGGAEMMEFVFDGTQEVPVLGWKPDYTGYSNTVNVKLHRMRYETASVVSGIIEQYSLSPFSRVLLELVPSLILYPRQQQQQRRRPGLSEDPSLMEARVPDARAAYTSIRARDEINADMSDRSRNQLMDI